MRTLEDEVNVAVSKIFDRGKTVIPSEIRRKLGVADGDKLVWVEDSTGRVYVDGVKSRRGSFRVLKG